jgi:hypothetical protein
MHRDSRNITRANVGAWSAGHPAVIASATYCAQPLGTVVVVVIGNGVNAMVTGGVLFRFVVIWPTIGGGFCAAPLASHSNVNAAKPVISHAPILIATVTHCFSNW